MFPQFIQCFLYMQIYELTQENGDINPIMLISQKKPEDTIFSLVYRMGETRKPTVYEATQQGVARAI